MTYRSFSTETWQDPWFENLSVKSKLMFIYLWTNDVCTQSGCYQISPRRIEFETSLKILDVIDELRPKVEYFPNENIVWVKAFFKRQCAGGKFCTAATRSLASIPKYIVDQWCTHNLYLLKKYGIDTLSIPSLSPTDTPPPSVPVPDTVPDTDTVSDDRIPYQGQPPKKLKPSETGFDDFWSAYPKRVGKLEAKKAWSKQNGNRPPTETILQKIEELKKSEQWMKDGGQFIPNPATWINRGGWCDEIPIMISEREKWMKERGMM